MNDKKKEIEQIYCTVGEAAKILGTKLSTTYRWVETGVIPSHKIGKRVLICISELHQRIKSFKVEAKDVPGIYM